MDVKEFKRAILHYSRKINDHITTTISRVGSEFGLTSSQIIVLMKLDQEGFSTVGNLAKDIRIADANLSTMCKKLEQLGYVSRVRDERDERIVRISLTDKGKVTIHDIDTIFNKKFTTIMKSETNDSLEIIINGLDKLNMLLEKVEKGE